MEECKMINDIRSTIMPEDMYVRQNLRSRDIKEGDIITAVVSEYNFDERRVYCEVSSHLRKAFIRLENFGFPEISSDFDRHHIPPIIEKHIGKQIVAIVVSKGTKGDFELDRKTLLSDTTSYLANNIGTVVTATVTAFGRYEAFIDIGNGVISRLTINEASINKCRNLQDIIKVGEQIIVKLMSFDFDTKRFEVSRKRAYERILFPYGSVQRVRVFGALPDGVHVEYNPGTVGIMDIPDTMDAEELYGKYVMCFIKSNKTLGFKANFVGVIDETP